MAIGDIVALSSMQGLQAQEVAAGQYQLVVQTAAGIPTTTVITKYVVTTAFASPAPGGALGDIVQSIATYNTTSGALISIIWSNLTNGAQYSSAPSLADLTQQATANPYGTQFFSYLANTASTGVSIGDIVQRSVNTDLVSGSAINVWYNISTGLQLTGGNIPPVANLTPITGGGSGGGGYNVQEFIYTATAGGAGYIAGDIVAQYRVLDTSNAPPTLVSITWFNITQNGSIATAPSIGNLTPGTNTTLATAANQQTEITVLGAISSKLPTSLGTKTAANSLSVTVASDAVLPLPSGAATSALQTAGNTTLTTIATNTATVSSQLPVSLGSKLSTASLSTVMASDATLPLPTGAATAANQATEIASLATIATKTTATAAQLPASLGSQTSANSLSTVLASDATLPLPTGASTSALQTTGNTTLSAISNKLPTALGPQLPADSLSVVVANGGGGEVSATALYIATVAVAGEYAIGDILQSVEVYTPGTPSTLLDTVWNNLTQQTVLTVAPPATDIDPVTGGGGTTATNIVATSTYAVKTAGSGYAVGDTLQEVIVYDPTGTTVVTTIWNNLTQGTVLGAAPVYANITASNSQLPPALGPRSAGESLSVYVQNPATGSTSVVNTYTVTTGWTDGSQAISVGETLQQILIFNSSGVLTATVWFDVDLAYTLLAPPPSYTLITQVTSTTATALNQTTQITAANLTNTNLSTISSQIPTTLGQKTSAASLSTVLASDATLPLPTGAATALKQDAGNTSLSSIATQSTITATNTGNTAANTLAISGQLPTVLGQTTNAASLSVALASDTTLPLPTGAATAANQSTGNTSLATIATQTTNTATSVAAISGQLPATLGPKTGANSLSVVVANPTAGDVVLSTQYSVVNAWTGASVGDTVVRYDIYTPGSPPTLVSETWFNITAGTTLAAGPASYSDVSVSSSSTVTPVLPQVTPSLITTSTSGTIAAGAKQISFANTGSAAVTIGSATLPAGASLDFTAPSGSSIAALTYDATGSSLLIATLV